MQQGRDAWRDQMRTEFPQAFDDITASRVARDFRETIAQKAFLAGKAAGRKRARDLDATAAPVVVGEDVRDAARFRALARTVEYIRLTPDEPNDADDDYLARMADSMLTAALAGD